MHGRHEPDYDALVTLFERTSRHDPGSREELQAWYDERAAAMRRGRQARAELGLLAYLASDRQAGRNLGRGGQFDDLPNERGSVSSRGWIRFQRFTDRIDRGEQKTVDDFVCRVNRLTRAVLLDMARERRRRARDGRHLQPGDDVVRLDLPTPDPRLEHEEYLTTMCRLRQVLPPHLFFLVVLHYYYKKPQDEIADLFSSTAYYINLDLKRAKAILDGLGDAGRDRLEA